jgi:quercetin dioxygenase-like cupin family protein
LLNSGDKGARRQARSLWSKPRSSAKSKERGYVQQTRFRIGRDFQYDCSGFVSGLCRCAGLAENSSQNPEKNEYPGDKYVCVLLEVDLDPEAPVPRHMHPGVESTYLASGSITLSVNGQPDRIVKAGEGYQIPPQTPHSIRNGPNKSTIISTLIVEKDKQLVELVPD